VQRTREEGVETDRELILEDDRSIQEEPWRIAQLAQDAAEALDARIEDENLEVLERVQSLLPSHPSGPGTNLTKGPGSRQAGLAMICKLMEAAETSWYFLVLSAICTGFIENSLGIH
jgi:hypothetical protein